MSRTSRTIPSVLAAFAALAIACSSQTAATPGGEDDGRETDGTVAACTVKGRTGKSSCQSDQPVPGAPPKDPITCSAGTTCSVVNGDAKCSPGCESDENCGPSERCVRCSNGSVGACRTCTITDDEACAEKPKADAATTEPATCERDTFWDKECASPGKAFGCPTNLEPTGQGECTQTDLAGVWCCGGGLASQCMRDSTADLSACQGKKAYSCPPDEEPADSACTLSRTGIFWCCPS